VHARIYQLADFGLATSTSRCKACGTLPYIAPEVLSNASSPGEQRSAANASSAATTAVDLWSIGVMLFELAAGERPFPSDKDTQPKEMLAAVMSTVHGPEGRACPRVPHEHLSELVMDLGRRLLVVNPATRLGAKCFGELQSHRFFAQVRWDALLELHPPFVPQLASNADDGYFPTFHARGEKMRGCAPSFSSGSLSEITASRTSSESSQSAACAHEPAATSRGVCAAQQPCAQQEQQPSACKPTGKYGQLGARPRPNYGQLAPNVGRLSTAPTPMPSLAGVPRVNVDELLALTKASVREDGPAS
jgi:serine/threonine protein kinase